MKDYVIVYKENGEPIKIEVILSFRIDKINKDYVVYTINDDNVQENVAVIISEIDQETHKIKSILPEEKDIVMEYYEQVKKVAFEN